MNIQDLAKIDINDLKNLDFAKIQEDILAKPDIAVNVALVLLSIFIMFQFYNGRQAEIKTLMGKLEELNKKVTMVDTYYATQKQLNEFKTDLPKGINEYKMIEELSNFASNRNVKISSYTPASRESKKYFDKVIVNLSVSTHSYKDMCMFVNDIENSDYALRLDNWHGSMEDAGETTAENGNINAQITVASINFKNEQQ